MTSLKKIMKACKQGNVPIDIERMLLLSGGREINGYYHPKNNPFPTVPAEHLHLHVSCPIQQDDLSYLRYALLIVYGRHGMAELGDIDQETKIFQPFCEGISSFYELVPNSKGEGGNVVNKMYVPVQQIALLKPIEEILGIPGISVREEFTPVGVDLEFM